MTPTTETVTPRAKPAVKRAQQVIGGIERELEKLALDFERKRDVRCVFARAYAVLTRVLVDGMPRAGFSDPAWIAQLGAVFSDYYLRALREFDAQTLPAGAWSSVFEAGRKGQTSVLEDLVLGMTAHIVNDLPRALCDVGLVAPNGHSRLGDYHLLNDVLGKAIERIQKVISQRYDPVLGVLDQLFESYDEILTDYGLRISRATAWYNALRLLDPASRAATSAAIAQSPEVTLREILDPPAYSLRLVFRTARVLARSTRRWPSLPTDRRSVPCPPTSISTTST
ncbi:MAG TPA: DUF5995 family protein [Polyangiales bacterium]|jgi:hypothetical protein|nr:DUF5995 family protein [Polyangiales bacterium]